MDNDLSKQDILGPQYQLLRQRLEQHPLYDTITTHEHLQVFMQHHVYAVWDFMSLIKALQRQLAPVRLPWVPPANSRYANFINQLVLEEESDRALTDNAAGSHASHFQSYCGAMQEIGTDTQPVLRFIQSASTEGIEQALQSPQVPQPARQFMRFTFDTISRDRAHQLAAILAYGRESLVPLLFTSLLDRLQINPATTPALHAYLLRHIELDEHEHGPMAMTMAHELCQGSPQKKVEVRDIAVQALQVRLAFWDGIYQAITNPADRLPATRSTQKMESETNQTNPITGQWAI